jgi:hypothetical protein
MNPLLTGLIATAVGLLVVVCAVVVALYRRHQHRRHPRQAKLSQLEAALHQADDPVSADGGCAGAGHTTPLNPAAASAGGVIVAADHRNTEDTDPDIIPNKYGMSAAKHYSNEILTAVKMLTVVGWVVTPCVLVGGYQPFGGISCHF